MPCAIGAERVTGGACKGPTGVGGLGADRLLPKGASVGSKRGDRGWRGGKVKSGVETRVGFGSEVVCLGVERLRERRAFVGSERGLVGRRGGKVGSRAGTVFGLGSLVVCLGAERLREGRALVGSKRGLA